MKYPSEIEIILASQSPRRLSLLQSLQISVRAMPTDISEDFDDHIPPESVAQTLAMRKANALQVRLGADTNRLILAADTVVILGDKILNKPANFLEAKSMLQSLSGQMHRVITGVCIQQGDFVEAFSEETKVYFADLDSREIDFYVEQFSPLDKAGAYGIQEWIGMIAVERIEGDYYNVMGLPLHRVWEVIQRLS